MDSIATYLPPPPKLSGLDLGRGFAAACIVLHHACGHLGTSAAGITWSDAPVVSFVHAVLWLPNRLNREAVLFFIVLSGFCVHLAEARRLAHGVRQPFEWKRYYARRLARLLPVVVGALIVTFLSDLASRTAIHRLPTTSNLPASAQVRAVVAADYTSPRQAAGTLFFAQPFWIKPYGSNYPLWVLGYLFFFYLLYPVWVFLTRRFGAIPAMVVALGIMAATVLVCRGNAFALYPIPRTWWLWCWGAFLAEIHVGRILAGTWHREWIGRLAVPGAVVTLLVMLGLPAGRHSLVDDVLWAPALGMIVFGLAQIDTTEHGRLWRAVSHLGDMSFSLYVVHMPIMVLLCVLWIWRFSSLPQSPWLVLSGSVVMLLPAWAFYALVEKPTQTVRGRR